MNTPNPLVPQGALTAASKGKSTVRIAVFTIVAIHAVFFAGLLMQGCKRDSDKPDTAKLPDFGAQTNELAKIDANTNSNYLAPLTDTAASTNLGAAAPAPGLGQPAPLAPAAPAVPEPAAPAPAAELKEYKVAKGDSLAKIAKAHHVTVGEIDKANPGLDPKKLKPDQKIMIPVSAAPAPVKPASAGAASAVADAPKLDAPAASNGAVHEVKPGETLTKIAKQHHTTVKAIRAANHLKTDRLVAKQKLKIPAPSAKPASTQKEARATTNTTPANPVQ